jgi:hypothetical protein
MKPDYMKNEYDHVIDDIESQKHDMKDRWNRLRDLERLIRGHVDGRDFWFEPEVQQLFINAYDYIDRIAGDLTPYYSYHTISNGRLTIVICNNNARIEELYDSMIDSEWQDDIALGSSRIYMTRDFGSDDIPFVISVRLEAAIPSEDVQLLKACGKIVTQSYQVAAC